MPRKDWLTFVILGGVFVLLGIGAIIWGKREETRYYDALSSRLDLREFLSHWPPRAEPGALKAGGWISLALGLILVGWGLALLRWGT